MVERCVEKKKKTDTLYKIKEHQMSRSKAIRHTPKDRDKDKDHTVISHKCYT